MNKDSDNDGIEDGIEIKFLNSEPDSADSDNDGLLDNEEKEMYLTSLISADTDNDGLSDKQEISLYLGSQKMSNTSNKNLKRPSVASNGTVSMVVWDSIRNSGNTDDVIGRKFDTNGIPIGNPFVVNQYKLRDQSYADISSDGETFFAVWENERVDGLSYQLFDNEGNLDGDEQFLIEEFNKEYLSVCAGADGIYLICYPVLGTYDYDLKGCLFDSAECQIIKSFNITSGIGNDTKPSVCFYGDGYFIAWQREKQDGLHDVYALLLDNEGDIYVDEMRINTTFLDDLSPSAASNNTTICVVWESLKDDGKSEVRARLIDKIGSKLGSEIVLKTDDAFSYHNPAVASNGIYYAFSFFSYYSVRRGYSSVQYEIFDSTLLNLISDIDVQGLDVDSPQDIDPEIIYNKFDVIVVYNEDRRTVKTFHSKGVGTSPINSDTDNDGLSDSDEFCFKFTNPKSSDTDGDLLPDKDELYFYRTNPLICDSDYDGVIDGYEILNFNTDPLDPDHDNDGMNDGFEIMFNFNPNHNDSGFDNDGDGITNLDEYMLGYNPLLSDTDNDGLSDRYELQNGLSALLADTDGDGLIDSDELAIGTSAVSLDTDNDGINDFAEIILYDTDPLLPDYDGDGFLDGEEVIQYGTLDFKVNTDYRNVIRSYPSVATNGSNLALVWLNCNRIDDLAETISLRVYDNNFYSSKDETVVVTTYR